mgnify:CR=1 FL=1|tara:strand:- start:575 stop:1102 length:528 start_codon:yes stop_codon:yes gene_type:complete
MKYCRLTFRYNDRISGSSFSEPQFKIGFPFGATRYSANKTIGVVLEQATIAVKEDDATNNAYVAVAIKNALPNNAMVSVDGNFQYDNVLSRVVFYSQDTDQGINYYIMNNQYNDKMGNLLQFPVHIFNNQLIQFKLTSNDEAGIVIPDGTGNAETSKYVIVLGLYYDDDDYHEQF